LVDALARDAHALLAMLHDRRLDEPVGQAARLLATVVGQDLDCDEARVFRMARRVAKDPVISTVDPQVRHGARAPRTASTATRVTSRSTWTAR
jgi:hypothetical protein